MNRIKLAVGLIATSICCMGNEMPAKAHHVNRYVDNHLGNYCIQQIGYAACTCIEADLLKGGKGYGCTIPVNQQQPLIDPWTNPFAGSTLQAPRITF